MANKKINQKCSTLKPKIEKSKKILSPFLTSSYGNQESRVEHYFRLKRACSPYYRGASFCAPGRKQAKLTWPDDEQTMWAKMDMAKTDIVLGNDAAAQAALDSLIADYNDHPDLPKVVFVIGEQYYNKAFRCKKEGLDTEARGCFEKALAIWEIITELPPNAVYPAEAYLSSGECYRRLGQHQTAIEYYQKVVDDWPDYKNRWYAQFLIGCGYEQLRDSGIVEKSVANAQIRAAYEQVLQEYPDCPAAKAADNWLKCYVKSSQGGQK